MPDVTIQDRELVPLQDLKPHPRNYRTHPDNQVEHLMHSIKEFGFYRNIVIAKDNTILAGHGVALAARRLDLETVPVVRLDIPPDHPLALKLLAADNYLPHFAEDDDRMLTEMLRDLADTDIGLFGTGFDEAQLALLTMVTRPASEIADFDAAAEWTGMPKYETNGADIQLIIHFLDPLDRAELIEKLGLMINQKVRQTWATWWPPRPKDDNKSLLFDG